jgi:hypothetical protein
LTACIKILKYIEIIEEKVNHKIKYNYWIYLLTGVAFFGCMRYLRSHVSETGDLEISKLIRTETVMIISSSIAWVIGKRYSLNYGWICCLAGLGYFVILPLIQAIFEGVSPIGIPIPLEIILLLFFGGLFLGGIMLVISYPFQYLYLKLRNYRNLP